MGCSAAGVVLFYVLVKTPDDSGVFSYRAAHDYISMLYFFAINFSIAIL